MSAVSPFIIFIISAIIVVITADRLAKYGDIIAVRTNAGGLLIGTILLAGATSLPEMIASIRAFQLDVPQLAGGNFLGSNMVNIMLLAMLDLLYYRVPLIRREAITQTMTAVLGILLTGLAIVFMLAQLNLTIGTVGVDSLVLIGVYVVGVWLIQTEGRAAAGVMGNIQLQVDDSFPTLRHGVIGFLLSAGVLALVVPQLVNASNDIATIYNLGATFVGTAMLSLVTSLPELLAAYAAVRINALDLAVGNLFGSTVFNMLGLGLADFFYRKPLLSTLGTFGNDFVLMGALGIVLTTMAVLGNLGRVERRLWFIEVDAVLIMVTYLAGMYLLFVSGH